MVSQYRTWSGGDVKSAMAQTRSGKQVLNLLAMHGQWRAVWH